MYPACRGDRILLAMMRYAAYLAVIAKSYEVKRRLAKINANRANLHIDDPP
jgi:hypothetical protein